MSWFKSPLGLWGDVKVTPIVLKLKAAVFQNVASSFIIRNESKKSVSFEVSTFQVKHPVRFSRYDGELKEGHSCQINVSLTPLDSGNSVGLIAVSLTQQTITSIRFVALDIVADRLISNIPEVPFLRSFF